MKGCLSRMARRVEANPREARPRFDQSGMDNCPGLKLELCVPLIGKLAGFGVGVAGGFRFDGFVD